MSLFPPQPDPASSAGSTSSNLTGTFSPDPTLGARRHFPRPTLEQVLSSHLVVIDDDPEIATMIADQLRAHGFSRVDVVTDSAAAVATIRELHPDLILLDAQMPTPGMEVLRRLKQSTDLHCLPVILFTGDHSEQLRLDALDAGADDFLTKPVEPAELFARVRNSVASKLLRDQIEQHSEALEADTLRDGLTGTANRRAFDYELGRRFVDWQRLRSPLSLLMIDIDYFKSVNDQFGHLAGDRVLERTAEQIHQCIRDMDLLARYGGEEFAVVLPGTDRHDAVATAERIRSTISRTTMTVGNEILSISVSIGVATAVSGDDETGLVRRADEALYESKRTGRNRVSLHDGSRLISPAAGPDAWTIPTAAHFRVQAPAPPDETWKSTPVAIVSSDVYFRRAVGELLAREGYSEVVSASDPMRMRGSHHGQEIEVVLLDIDRDLQRNIDWLKRCSRSGSESPAVIGILPAHAQPLTERVIEAGASEILTKPVRAAVWSRRLENLIRSRDHAKIQTRFQEGIEREARLRTAEIAASRRELVHCLARLGEGLDDPDGQHVIRVGRYAALLGEGMGMDPERVSWLELAAQLHDLGKLGTRRGGPADGPASSIQPVDAGLVGARILRSAGGIEWSALTGDTADSPRTGPVEGQSPLIQMAARICEAHRERWDGTGTPNQLAGDAIPLEARITALAIAFEKVTEGRIDPHSDAFASCLSKLERAAGTRFDPAVVAAFVRQRTEFVETLARYARGNRNPGGPVPGEGIHGL